MRREQLPPHKTATYVLERYKTVYVSVPKAACTSLKWLVAELQDEDRERFYGSRSREVGRAMTIHRRDLWNHTPMLHELPRERLEAISPDDGWFIFAVVRHPSARLWAAWQSKFLLGEPRWIDEFSDAPWLPRVPKSTEDVIEDFGRFVESIADDPRQPVMRDRHFMAQRELVTPDKTPYSKIYDTREIPKLLGDLEAHLHRHGMDRSVALRRSNESPLTPLAATFAPKLAEAIESVYGADFDAFGYTDPVPPGLDAATEYPRALLGAIGLLAERSERIGDLATRAQWFADGKRELRKENDTLRKENKALRRENHKLRARPGIRAVVRRAYRRLSSSR